MAFGTWQDTKTYVLELINPSVLSVTQLTGNKAQSRPHSGGVAISFPDGSIGIIGGYIGVSNDGGFERWTVDGERIVGSASMITPWTLVYMATANFGDGTPVVMGGYMYKTAYPYENPQSTVWKVDTSGTCTSLTTLPTTAYRLAAATFGDGSIGAFGGQAAPSGSVYVNNYATKITSTGTKTTLPALTYAKTDLTAATLGDGRILVVGGGTYSTNTTPIVEVYSSNGTKTTFQDLNIPSPYMVL